ncbi:MAG: AMIN domain-containing protein [Alphaproteobacteria bacterium]|nr:AMIN domain-containing protein [Alphaproteobacteria bacterium]
MYTNQWRVWALAVVLAWFVAGTAMAQIVVSRLGFVSGPERTRITLDLSQRVDPHSFVLADPYRAVVDLPQVSFRWAEALPTPADGPIAGFRHGLFKPGTSRLVVDLRQPMKIVQAQVIEPGQGQGWRLVVDLAPTTREAFLQALGTPATTTPAQAKPPAPPQDGQMPRRADGRRTIVLDPGHGGIDPGTTGVGGVREKTLTLEIAQDLKRALEASGRYHVVLTRSDDSFVRLRERIQIARSSKGEIFLSLHADALGDASFRGMTVYTLSDKASDAEAEALAQRENKSDLIAGVDLRDEAPEVASILIDLAQRETMNLSARLAGHLVQELSRDVQMPRNGHRFAGFAVLKAPDVPSALIELGYLSNRQDTQLLAQPAHRRKLGQAVLRALDSFFKSRPGAARAG